MKKILFFSLLAGMALAGCTNDELVNGSVFGGDNDYIGFVYNSSNMTRGNENLQNSHYEFGVFADNGEKVMDNYLVAWSDGSNVYAPLVTGATTYGDPTSQVDGLSYWFYEGLTPTVGTAYNKADNLQILKFWDKSKDSYKFWAYAPYTSETTAGDNGKQNAKKVEFDKDNNKFTFTSLSSFYTSPVTGKQITTADVEGPTAITPANYDAEMINYNEALYAYNLKAKSAYGSDVDLEFKHINAKVNLKFYSDIKGYDVEIIDVIPSAIAEASHPNIAGAITAANGIQLSPSTTVQSWIGMNSVQPKKLPTYYSSATVSAVANGTAENITVANEDAGRVNYNLVFGLPTGNIGTDKETATKSPTTLYVLPNVTAVTGGTYITPGNTFSDEWKSEELAAADKTKYEITTWNGGTASTSVADSTGYTLHLSYTLKPKDGSANITIYDARVFVPASACKWAGGYAYTYVFKITKNTNGTTDPLNEGDPYTKTGGSGTTADPYKYSEPYVDVSDPRVPSDPSLIPIVFDGVTVVDYEAADGGEYALTDNSLDWALEQALNSITKIYSKQGGSGSAIWGAKGGSGTDALPYTFTLATQTSDYIAYTGDVNNNNAFKDLQAFSQALFNQQDIATIEYKGTIYKRSHTTTPPSWYPEGGGLSLEATIATDIFDADNIYLASPASKTTDKIKLNHNNPAVDVPLYVTLTVTTTNDENVDETAVKKAVANFTVNSHMGTPATYAADAVTIKAYASDFKWSQYPEMNASINVNENNVYRDLNNFLALLNAKGVTSITYDGTTYTTFDTTDQEWQKDDKVLTSEIARTVFASVAPNFTAGTYSATITVGSTAITLEVTLE